jgi:ribosome-binding factor A
VKPAGSDGRRPKRVAELLRSHLTELITRDLGDEKLSLLVITSLEISDDLSLARILVRKLGDDGSEKGRKDLVRSIGRAAPRLRRALGPRLGLRRVPELRFEYDLGQDKAQRVDEILAEIASERQDGEPDEG